MRLMLIPFYLFVLFAMIASPAAAQESTAHETPGSKPTEAAERFRGLTAANIENLDNELRAGISNPLTVNVHELRTNKVPQIGAFQSWLRLAQSSSALSIDRSFSITIAGPAANPTNYIVGGLPFDGIPAIGALQVLGDTHCTGSIIAPHTILTAAHCVYGYDPTAMDIEFAIGPDARMPTKRYKVTGGVYNEHYDHGPGPSHLGINDVGLFYTDQGMAETPIPIPSNDIGVAIQNNALIFVGYGFTLPNMNDTLGRKGRVGMTIDPPPDGLQQTTFTFSHDGENICNGDSGGPALLYSNQGNSFQVAGISSWGDGACDRYGVDMRADYYTQWITQRER